MARPTGLYFPLGTALVLCGGLLANPPDDRAAACGNHGTAVSFLDSPSAAARQARADEKLVFVLHVSGQFEDPGLT